MCSYCESVALIFFPQKDADGIEEIVLSEDLVNGEKHDKASLERQRTAWNSGIGHRRVTRAEVKQR